VACQNKLSTCESAKVTFASSYDCTPPPTPVVNVVNNGSSLSTNNKGNNASNLNELFGAAIQTCKGSTVTLNATNCSNGAVFWSDGFVGSPRVLTVDIAISNLSASCKAFNLVKSSNSNSLDFTLKPTPILTIVDTLVSATTVNLTAPSNFASSILPTGSILGYFTDANTTVIIQNPQIVSQSNRYYIKATAPSGCFDVEPVQVLIDICSANLVFAAGIDDVNAGSVNKKTKHTILANNKITGTARTEYQAGKFILFGIGFEAKPGVGGSFKAQMGGCP
jgi:hypothetical protein